MKSYKHIYSPSIAVLKRGEVCPMPTEAYALCPREHLMLLRKAIAAPSPQKIPKQVLD